MNDQSIVITSASGEQTLKRKRGRPRQDDSTNQGNYTVVMQEWGSCGVNECREEEPNAVVDDGLLGQVVSGVLSGSFDAGFFVTMKPQNSDTTLTGLVFYPGKFVPVTPENDLAPQAKMYERKEYDIANLSPPILHDCSTPQQQNNNQLALPLENETHNSVDRALDDQLRKSFSVKVDSKSASLVSSPAYAPVNDTSNELKGPELSHQGFEFGVDNFYTPVEQLHDYRIVDQDEIMKEFEASACMNVPSSASEPSDYRLDSMSELQNVYPESSIINNKLSHNQEVAVVDPCLKLNESVQFDKETPNEDSCHVVNPSGSGFLLSTDGPSEVVFSLNNTQVVDSEYDCPKTIEPSMMLFHSEDPVHSDLKLGFEKAKCPTSSSSEPSLSASVNLPSMTDDKKKIGESSGAPFFINLTDTWTETRLASQHPVSDRAKLNLDQDDSSDPSDRPTTESINFMGAGPQATAKTNDSLLDRPTQETVSSELKLSGTVPPKVSSPPADALGNNRASHTENPTSPAQLSLVASKE
uniref:Uncharacterized protein n=1 Tax=Kalanchoe fedtschenkoi TaxID=63787 RepID=A0A7N0UCX1_KALFE